MDWVLSAATNESLSLVNGLAKLSILKLFPGPSKSIFLNSLALPPQVTTEPSLRKAKNEFELDTILDTVRLLLGPSKSIGPPYQGSVVSPPRGA